MVRAREKHPFSLLLLLMVVFFLPRSKRMYRAHYADDLAVTQRLLNEDLVLIHDQVFRFDARGVLYSWSPGSKMRETNFYDVYTSLVEKEGESGDEVGYLADL